MPLREAAAPLTERRVLVYGVTGSGKSTAASRIAGVTGLPLHLVDDLTWLPGWVPVESEIQRRTFADLTAADSWILDTAYGAWLDVALERCQLIVALDYPRWLSLGRLVRRTVARLIDRRTICNGNVQTLRKALSPDSIIVWHFQSFARNRVRMRAWAAAADGVPVLLFRRPVELERWLLRLETAATPPRGPRSTSRS